MSYSLMRPFLFQMDPEKAHALTLDLLEQARKFRLLNLAYGAKDLPTTCMGIHLPNPVGLAAGLDKNGEYIDALSELGFGFLEVGTVTPRPQVGNPLPRLFRLVEEGGVINRMGFNNNGVDELIKNVERSHYKGVLGINIGKNTDTPNEDALKDYVYCLERAYYHASYITLNISSPNSKNLRNLQKAQSLHYLLEGIKNCHSRLKTEYGFYVPLALKISPDLEEKEIDDIAKELIQFEIDGVIATNTTTSRPGVQDATHSNELGGLSGRPLSHESTVILRKFSERLHGKVELIGVGGIDNGERAVNKITAGAKAVQLYTGLIYRGPELIQDCVNAIANYRDSLLVSEDDELLP